MAQQLPSSDEVIKLVAGLITPMNKIERTMVMPFNKKRHENDAEHSFSLGFLACALAQKIDTTLDIGKVAQYALVHDIVEVYVGDISVWESEEVLFKKNADEALAAEKILKNFPYFPWVAKTYNEYKKLDTPEKCFIYALDKIYPHILIVIGKHHPVRPTWETYIRREAIICEKIKSSPALVPLFDDLCRIFRKNPRFFATPIPKIERVKKNNTNYTYNPRPHNPLVTLIRQQSTEIIENLISRYKSKAGFKASHLDVLLQVMLISCSYKPSDIWLSYTNDVKIATELVAKDAVNEASEVMTDALDKGHIWLNEKLIKEIANHEIEKLHKLQPKYHGTIKALTNQQKVLKTFKSEAVLTSLGYVETKNNTMASTAVAIEKHVRKNVYFRKLNKVLSKKYAEKFHYLHTGRDDDTFAFGAFLEGETHPFAWVSYAPIGRVYKHQILKNAGINPEHSLELTRAWNHEYAPTNTMSMLFAYAHDQIQRKWSKKYKTQLIAILTDVNPNLGFKGSAFRAVGFGLIGQKPTTYNYVIDDLEKRHYFTRRKLENYLKRNKNNAAKYMNSVFPLLPTQEFAVILNGSKRVTPLSFYHVNETEYKMEVAVIR